MLNIAQLMKFKGAWDTFTRNHPKFPSFLTAVQQEGLKEDTIIEITVRSSNGKELTSNVKLKESDIELFRELSKIANK